MDTRQGLVWVIPNGVNGIELLDGIIEASLSTPSRNVIVPFVQVLSVANLMTTVKTKPCLIVRYEGKTREERHFFIFRASL